MESSATIADNNSSQETTKKPKITLDEMDPLGYFSRFLGISETILNHLNGKDLIKVSEVRPNWYNVIAPSKYLMEKIKVVLIDKCERRQEDYDLLKNSSRKYQSIEVVRRHLALQIDLYVDVYNIDYITDFEVDFLLSKSHDWKCVSINETYFRRIVDLGKFLSSIKSSVESFSVSNRGFGLAPSCSDFLESPDFESLEFPKLKHLKMHFREFHNIGVIYERLFIKCVAIEKFDLNTFHYRAICMDSAVTKMLENCNKLTSLSLLTSRGKVFECDCWKRFQFKLKSLTIAAERTIEHSEEFGINFQNFLKSQIDHLEELTIDLGYDLEMFELIMKLPKLKSLCLRNSKMLSMGDVPNEISLSITQLKVMTLANPETLKLLLKSMPNVKNLCVGNIDKKIFQVLLEIDRKFEELKVYFLRGVEEKDLDKLMIDENKKCVVENYKFFYKFLLSFPVFSYKKEENEIDLELEKFFSDPK